MRILLIGSTGQLAQDIHRVFQKEKVVGLSHADLEIRDPEAVERAVQNARPEVIINTAAFHRVDACEDQAEQAFAVNAVGTANLARSASRAGAALVHFSTDYVFDGAKSSPYVETDSPRPLSLYGMSKLAGEFAVRRYCEKHFVIRTCGLYGMGGSRSKGGNIVETMLRLAREGKSIRVVNDQTVTPTGTRDLAEKLLPLIRTDRFGLFHMTNTGSCSWHEFVQEIFRKSGLSPDLAPTTSKDFGSKATRPPYSVLDNAAYRSLGFPDFRPWQEALADYLKERESGNGHGSSRF